MQIKKHEGKPERAVLIGMIVNPTVLGRIATKWTDKGLFASKQSNLIGSWCVKFFNKYNEAPQKSIERLFESWSVKANDKEMVGLVDQFLGGLSGEYEQLAEEINANHLLDVAGQLFNRVGLEKLVNSVQGDLDIDALDKAEHKVASHLRVELGIGSWVDPLLESDEDIKAMLAEKAEPLIRYKGALGGFFGDALERDGFVAFMAPEKRGKSAWLLDVAWRAMLQGRKVAYFEVGDQTENQVKQRIAMRASKRPVARGEIKVPTYVESTGRAQAQVDFETRAFKKPMTWIEVKEAYLHFTKGNSKVPLLRLSCHPNSSINVQGIQASLEVLERADWVPDIVVVDYADILAPMMSGDDVREQTNKTWKALRGLSQSKHCLVVTATQSDAASYRAETMDRSHFSEDKRKLAHVTGMVGINQTKDEKPLGLMRLNWVVRRNAAFDENKCVHVAGCLAIANPAIKSSF